MQKQTEIKESVKLLKDDGTLNVVGWARRNVFDFDRNLASPRGRLKEWDFYQVSNGKYMVQISFFNITLASAASACILDLETGEKIETASIAMFTKNKYPMPPKGDVPNYFKYEKSGVVLEFDTKETSRTIKFSGKAKGKPFDLAFTMDIAEGLENITIVTPFKDMPTRFFMTTKQNCMPCEGNVVYDDKTFTFDKKNSFAVLDWGRGVWPHKNVWYWGNGATYINDKLFGFEITWKIGNEENATETCVFYDKKAHKIGVVDVEKFPGDGDKWMEPWHFTSDDGRFDMTMTPFYDHKTGVVLFNQLGMKCHQVHGKWNGFVILDDGTRLDIKDMYAFCEYVENAW